MKIFKSDLHNKYTIHFDTKDGFYIRSDILNQSGNPTGEDPFMASYPELLDVGIMNFCIHGKNGLCKKAGIQCYQNGSNRVGPNMSLENYKSIVDQSKDRVLQIALGGAGDPNKHENFKDILEYTRDNNIIPNYTTSGFNLTVEEVATTKEFCGAGAISWYRSEYTTKAIQMFLNAGVTTNIHYVLSNTTIDEAIKLIENDGFPKGINAVIFLLHKPIGQGLLCNVLKCGNPKIEKFFAAIENNKLSCDIGFDSCTIPGILNYTKSINHVSIDTCEAARYSAYISADMKMVPCSFDQENQWAVDLHENTILDAWNSQIFKNFRLHFENSCLKCKDRKLCMGGCPIKNEIVLCSRREKNENS